MSMAKVCHCIALWQKMGMDMDGWYIMLLQQESFKEENSSWSSVCVVIIDKDFTEWRILKQEFPDATVLFCT